MTNVTNYIATLLASVNVMYERDLNLRLLQGTTFLRVSIRHGPVHRNDNGNADLTELNEFGNYWSSNYPKAGYAAFSRQLLSGKQASSNSASGIAWVSPTPLCEHE